ncbi:MAG: glycosyltransferase family 4 protein [Candidatus Tenebribacter davisii]|nr:glycosyltransferase family 4 protein [Candidatus Tenebribacter davisii]
MKILFIPKVFPHSRIVGGPIIIYNRVKYLSADHEVHLLSFIREEQKQYIDTVGKYCKRVEHVPYPAKRGILRNIFDFFFSARPNYMLQEYSREMEQKVGEMVSQENYDVVISEFTMMAQYLYKNKYIPKSTKKVMSVHECYTVARLKLMKKQPFSWDAVKAFFYYVRLRPYEFKMYADDDLTLTLTPEGREEVLHYNKNLLVKIVPHGVDVDFFKPDKRKPEKNAVMFLGNFGHKPNVDAVVYFYTEILPLIREKIKDVKFYIVGQKPPQEILDYAEEDKVIVTGFVESVKPYFDRSLVSVIPVRLGGGFRGKSLEAMASGVPVVSTSLGVQGVDGKDGEQFLLAETAQEFADKVSLLLTDEILHKKLAENGRKLMLEKYSWQKGVEVLEKTLKELIAQ